LNYLPIQGEKICYIYKNLLRDMRIYLLKEYKSYYNSNDFKQKNFTIKLALFPLQIRSFVKDKFENSVINKFKNDKKFSRKALYFSLASLIMPK
jgi:hypothetical protein